MRQAARAAQPCTAQPDLASDRGGEHQPAGGGFLWWCSLSPLQLRASELKVRHRQVSLERFPALGVLRFSVFGSLWGPVRQVEPDGRDVCGCLCHLLPTWASTLGQHVARVVAGAVPEPAWC